MTAPSTDRLIHYLTLARTAPPQHAAQICIDATADPSLHQYAELLSTQSIAALQSTPHAPSYNLLRLFAHGTLSDYHADPSHFPPLTPAHIRKLRVLTLITLAHGLNTLSYDALQRSLHLDTSRDVEDVVVDAVYAGLMRARLHHTRRCVEVMSAVGRDVPPGDAIHHMIKLLRAWQTRSTALVDEIDEKIAFIRHETNAAREARARAAREAETVRKDVMAAGGKLMERDERYGARRMRRFDQ